MQYQDLGAGCRSMILAAIALLIGSTAAAQEFFPGPETTESAAINAVLERWGENIGKAESYFMRWEIGERAEKGQGRAIAHSGGELSYSRAHGIRFGSSTGPARSEAATDWKNITILSHTYREHLTAVVTLGEPEADERWSQARKVAGHLKALFPGKLIHPLMAPMRMWASRGAPTVIGLKNLVSIDHGGKIVGVRRERLQLGGGTAEGSWLYFTVKEESGPFSFDVHHRAWIADVGIAPTFIEKERRMSDDVRFWRADMVQINGAMKPADFTLDTRRTKPVEVIVTDHQMRGRAQGIAKAVAEEVAAKGPVESVKKITGRALPLFARRVSWKDEPWIACHGDGVDVLVFWQWVLTKNDLVGVDRDPNEFFAERLNAVKAKFTDEIKRGRVRFTSISNAPEPEEGKSLVHSLPPGLGDRFDFPLIAEPSSGLWKQCGVGSYGLTVVVTAGDEHGVSRVVHASELMFPDVEFLAAKIKKAIEQAHAASIKRASGKIED